MSSSGRVLVARIALPAASSPSRRVLTVAREWWTSGSACPPRSPEPEAQLHAALERYDSKSSLRILAPCAAGAISLQSAQFCAMLLPGFSILRYPTSASTPRSARGAGGSSARRPPRPRKPAQELLERGAEVDAPDECGDAALARAAMNERYDRRAAATGGERGARRPRSKTADEWCAHVGHAHLAARLAQAAAKARLRLRAKQSDVVVEWGPRIRAGAMVFQKTAFVHARRASEDGVLQTKEGERERTRRATLWCTTRRAGSTRRTPSLRPALRLRGRRGDGRLRRRGLPGAAR